jgi:transmembrane sensor
VAEKASGAVLTDSPSELTALEREGLAWVDRLTSGIATEGDVAEMQRWRGQSASHASAWSAAVRMRRLMAAHVATRVDAHPAALPHPAFLMGRRGLLGGAIAASLAAYAVARPPLGLWPSLDELRADYRTAKGERRTVTVAGARIELNTQTAIALNHGGVRLVAGEIAADTGAGGPFTVEARDASIRASHARFDVRDADGIVCVTCAAGAVDVAYRPSDTTRTLRAGEQLRYGAGTIGRVVPADLVRLTAWRQGLLIFHDERLYDVIAELNRYRPGRIILADGAGSRRFNGTFKTDRLDDALAQVVSVAGLSRSDLPGGVTLLT